MNPRRCHVPQHLAPSLAKALRDSGRLTVDAPGEHLLKARLGDASIIVEQRGDVLLANHDELHALVIQCIKGILPRAETGFLVGIDESGMGGEAKNPKVALVMISSEVRAELLAAGVRDSKRVGDDEIAALAQLVDVTAMRRDVLDVPVAAPGQSQAALVAAVAARHLLKWEQDGLLPTETRITFDRTDKGALQAAFGAAWAGFEQRIRMSAQAEQEHVEVAAASILARAGRQPATKQQTADVATGHFRIGKHDPADRDQILDFLRQLERSYPDIGKWIGKIGEPKAVWTRIENGEIHLTVAKFDAQVVGFCLTQDKDARNSKLSTFYVVPKFRRQHIGYRILDMELRRLAAKGIRRVMVTFGHEEFENMARFFRDHGFTLDGISPQRYRDNSYEVVMGKRLKHGTVTAAQFPLFIEHDVFRMQGYDVKHLDSHNFIATPRPSLLEGPAAKAHRLLVHVTTDPEPEKALAEVRKRAKEHAASPVLASSFGLPADAALPNDVEVLDALKLERTFFPVEIERPADEDVAIPIQDQFVRMLFPAATQATLAPRPLGLRTTNVYYKAARNDKGLRRGARLLFYESGPTGRGIVGVARLERIDEGSPKHLHAMHGGLGAWTADRISEHTDGKDGAAYRFTGYRPLRTPVSGDEVKALHPKFFPMTTYRLARSVTDQIIAKGGYT